ncbi:MAG TPA: neuraminidase-like domain-containing protein [Puia sp.]|nr:neuraminidase-like domain-containing protein [Puia sp.]
MTRITHPIKLHDAGAPVKDLQNALLSIAMQSGLARLGSLLRDHRFLKDWTREFNASEFGEATEQAVRLFQKEQMGVKPSGKVNKVTAAAINMMLGSVEPETPATAGSSKATGNVKGTQAPDPNAPLKVSGVVYDQWIEPLQGAPVMLFEKDLRSEHPVAEGETDEKGNYSIRYSKQKLTGDGGSGANLIVKVYGGNGDPIYTSDVHYNAAPQLQVNVNLGPRPDKGPSDFVKNVELIRPAIGDLPIQDLTENQKVHDLSFLINKTGIAANTLVQLVASFRFEKWTGLEAEVYYGILDSNATFAARKSSGGGLPTDTDTAIEQAYINFWLLPVTGMMTALKAAAMDNAITYRLMKKSTEIEATLQKLQTAPPQDAGATGTLPPVYSNIAIAGLNSAQQQAFLNLYSSSYIGPSFWTALSKDKNFQGATATISKLQVIYQVSDWTANNTALTANLVQNFSINTAQDLGKLVSNTVSDWVTYINNTNIVAAGKDQAATVQNLADSIAAGVENIYPTEVLADRFSKNKTLRLPNQSVIAGIISHPGFDITKSIPAFIQQNPLPEGSDTKTITNQVLGIQRTHKATGNAETTLTLLADNIQSARQVYSMGKANFVNKYSTVLGNDKAEAVYERAAAIHAGATNMMGQVASRVSNPQTKVMPNYSKQISTSKLMSEYPDLANLFGMGASYCECSDCESFLGIPAYLADLLDFLYERKTTTFGPIPHARAALLANSYTFTDGTSTARWHRRPDIGDIDMNCDNTNVELPYIDIVNELLEDYIIPPVACLKVAVPATDSFIYFIIWLIIYLKEGKINPYLCQKIIEVVSNDPRTPICNISLLTDQAIVSKMFLADGENLPAWIGPPVISVNPFGPLYAQWIIRDQFITLKINLVFGDFRQQRENDYSKGGGLPCNSPLVKFPLDLGNLPKDSKMSDNARSYYTNLGNSNGYKFVNEGGDGQDTYFELIIQEIHQTHLTTEEINANPEYTNTNVYNSLSDPFNEYGNNKWKLYDLPGGVIPISLPFDLYFTEANAYLQKIGVQRYHLIDTFRKQGGSSLDSIVIAYMGLSNGDEDIIFTPRFTANINAGAAGDPQIKFWGNQLLDGSGNIGVSLFLAESGLSFEQLQALLAVDFVNPDGYNQSYIADMGHTVTDPNGKTYTVYDPCDMAELVIANVTSQKMDAINRFVRLWTKLNLVTTMSMHELDMCILCPSIGNGALDMPFAEKMYYFLQLMGQMTWTAAQAIVLYRNIDTWTDKNDPTFINLYQQLFQNRLISNPLVPAFTLPLKSTTLITDANVNPGAVPVILTACEIMQADLNAIMGLTNPSYANLNLDNLSYIYACGLLSNALSIPVADIFTFMGLTGITPINPVDPVTLKRADKCSPKETVDFITKFNETQQAGFDIDGINYLLTNQSTANPSLIPDTTAVISGLNDIRTAIQAAITATTPVADPKGTLFKQWLADPGLNWNANVAAKLVSILGTAGTATYSATVQNNLRFLQLLQLQYQVPGATAYLEELPSIQFPDAGIAGIGYENAKCYLFYSGKMDSAQYNTLTTILPSDPATQAALSSLYRQSRECALSAALWQAVPPATTPVWLAAAQQNVPDFSIGEGVLTFTGAMSGPVYLALLAQSNDATYDCALTQLFVSTHSTGAGPITYVQLAALPAMALPDSDAITLSYNHNAITNAPELSFGGAMSAADTLALFGLANGMSPADKVNWLTAISTLYVTAVAGQSVSVPFPTLPSGWAALPGSFPDLSGIDGLYFSPGALSWSGTMTVAQLSAVLLPTNTTNTAYNNAVNLLLYNLRQQGSSAPIPLAALPTDAGFSFPVINGLVFSPAALCFRGQMNKYAQSALTNLSGDAGWTANINALYTNSQSTLATTALIPSGAVFVPTAGELTTFGLSYTPASGILSYQGVMTASILGQLQAPVSTSTVWTSAIVSLYQNSQTGGPTTTINLPAVSSFPPAAITAAILTTNNIVYTPAAGSNPATLQYTASPMNDTTLNNLLSPVSSNPTWTNDIITLYQNTQTASPTAITTLTIPVLGLGITFPPAGANLASLSSGNLSYTPASGILGYTGVMSEYILGLLAALPSTPDPVWTAGVTALYDNTQDSLVTAVQLKLPTGVTIPASTGITVTAAITPGVSILSTGSPLSPSVQQQLLGLSTDPTYVAAIGYLVAQISAILPATLPGIQLPLPDNNISSAKYTPGYILFTGTPNPDCMDEFNLQLLNEDPQYQDAIGWLYATPAPPAGSGYVAAVLNALPSVTLPSTLPISWANGELGYRGQMKPADYTSLQALSTDPAFLSALAALNQASQTTLPTETNILTTVRLGSLPPIAIPAPVVYDMANHTLYYTGAVQMPAPLATTLAGLSTDPYYSAAVASLANIAPVTGKYLIYAPAPSIPFSSVTLAAATTSSITYTGGTLSFTGTMSFPDYLGLLALSPDSDYRAAVSDLYAGAAATPYFPLPAMSIPSLYSTQLTYTATTSSLTLAGYISGADQSALLSFSTDFSYQQAINELYVAVNDPEDPESEFFPGIYEVLLPTQFGELIPPAAADLYEYFLDQISPVYQPIKEDEALATQIAGAFGIGAAVASVLVAGLPDLADSMTEPGFAANNKPINPDPNQFPQAMWYMKLARMAFLITQFNLGAADTDWLLDHAGQVGAIDLTAYPTAAAAIPFRAWEIVYNLCTFNRAYKPQTIPDPANPGDTIQLSVYSIISDTFDLVAAISGLSYMPAAGTSPAALVYQGQMNAATRNALDSLSNDPGWRTDIHSLFSQSQSTAIASVTPVVPAGTVFPPVGIRFPVYGVSQPVAGTLQFSGVMDKGTLKMLTTISADPFWATTVTTLYNNTQANLVSAIQLTLPPGLTAIQVTTAPGVSGITGVTDATTGLTVLSATGPISAAVQTALQAVSTDSTYQAAIGYLIAQKSAIVPGVIPRVFQFPPDHIPYSAGAVAFTGYPDPGMLLTQLVQLTGWDITELRYLLNVGQTTGQNLNPLWLFDSATSMACEVDLCHISILLRLAACFNMAKQMRVVPSRCVTWAVDPITNNTAIDIKQALKAIYPDQASWMSAIQPIVNILRQDRRDAVLAYLLTNPVRNVWSWPGTFSVFPDEYHAYGNFLIDLEMSSCQPTTRIIQAYCSIQQFVQRCLMNIEAPGIVANSETDPDWLQWNWMGTFESWYEARYNFLYPENFILPQTLPNQSPFFQDMQNNMTQGPVTTALVETAYGSYLQSLDEVARLEVKGMWFDHPSGVLHVFARTFGGDPAVYYYRTFNALYQWTPWQKVTADISSDQIIPVVQNGRLYLYWPIFTQTSDDDKSAKQVPSSSGGTAAPPPSKYWTIQMAYSEYNNGQWSGKKISKDFLASQIILTSAGSPVIYPDKSDFVFMALDIPQPNVSVMECMENNNNMYIACYQSVPETFNLEITINWFNKNVVEANQQQIFQINDINPIQPMFNIDDLIADFNGAPYPPKILNDNYTNIDLMYGDPTTTIQSIVNSLLNDAGLGDLTIKVSFSFQFAGKDNLYLINSGTSPVTYNAFLLDAQRGYCTAVDLWLLDSQAEIINTAWFYDTVLSNNQATTTSPQGPLDTAEGPGIILGATQGQGYSVVLPLQMGLTEIYDYIYSGSLNMQKLGELMPFFFQDGSCTFFVGQALRSSGSGAFYYYFNEISNFKSKSPNVAELSQFLSTTESMDSGPNYQFINFYHPYTHQFIKIYANPRLGIESILTRPIQLTGDPTIDPVSGIPYGKTPQVLHNLIVNIDQNPSYTAFDFASTYDTSGSAGYVNADPAFGNPIEQMDFGPQYSLMGQLSSYGQYNWELFFHSVLMSAIQLSQNQQFADADRWFKFIFNPTDTSKNPDPQKFWVTKPFFENIAPWITIDDLIMLYEINPTLLPQVTLAFWESINLWRNDPYDPHILAQLRLTPYMYTTFMKYLDNLIAWANYNYLQYTMESVNIAIQLFMTALECLGTKPVQIPPIAKTPTLNYYQMELDLEVLSLLEGPEGYLSDPVVQFENVLPPASPNSNSPASERKLVKTPGLYFCIPPNPVLLAYWDTIETQLYKIRHCLNNAGQFQPLSPFPNVPGFNMDGSGVADFGGVLPNYRFSVMIQKATELCNEVKSLGSALLAALEKQDAEGLALLHATQEITVQQNIDILKNMQIADANFGYQNLQAYQTLVTDKQSYYGGLIQAGLLSLETKALALNQSSLSREDPIVAATMIAGILHAIPSFTLGAAGFGGSPEGHVTLGGQQLGAAADAVVQYLSYQSHCDDKNAALNTVNAGYQRRAAEWAFQQQLATDELAQISIQLQSAQKKIDIATQDEKNQQTVIQNAQDVQTFLQNKYTNQQLYSWMVTQISNVYFQSYQMAYSFAKQAEVCYGYELGITGASYISYGYWDSLHKGLLSGEALMYSLKKMETDYYANNIREYELTRQISLAQLDPAALLQLKANGTCFINIPEELFDLDYPGHYFRRVKHVAVTIPGVVGPYTPVCLKMTLMNNSVRMVANPTETPNSYPRHTDSNGAPTNDSRFLDNYAAIQYIATSNGVNDSGLFEMNLHDDRYLPFERAGAISTWQLEFPSAYPQFDLSTITDLIIHLSYTSRDGGPAFQAAATASVQSKLSKAVTAPGLVLMRAFSARHDFPTQWYQFLNPTMGSTQQLTMDITQRFPYFTKGLTIKISSVVIVADIPATAGNSPNWYLSGTKLSNAPVNLGPDPQYGTMQYSVTTCRDTAGVWNIVNNTGGTPATNPLTDADITDLYVIFHYSLTKKQ